MEKVGILLNKKNTYRQQKLVIKGQIVIPKDARELFNIKNGDSLILFGDII